LIISGGLPTDGTLDGAYTQLTTIVDSIGTTSTDNLSFTYDTQAPLAAGFETINGNDVHTAISEGGVTNNPLAAIAFTCIDATTILDTTPGRVLLELRNADNAIIAGTTVTNQNVVRFNLASILPNDGTADGLYTLSYQFQDLAANVTTGRLHFHLINPNSPQLASTEPVSGAQIGTLNPAEIVIRVSDTHGLALDDFANTYLRLHTPSGAILAHGNNATQTITVTGTTYTIRLSLANALNEDGEYQVEFRVQNQAGYAYASSYRFTLDTTAPVIRNFYAVNEVSDETITPDDILYRVIDGIRVVLQETGTSIDFTSDDTYVYLTDSFGNRVPGQFSYSASGNSMAWTLDAPLTQVGRQFVAHASVADVVGNVSTGTVSFQLNAFNGEVLACIPQKDAAVSGAVDRFSVQIQDLGLNGINSTLTYIQATHPNGSIIGDPNSAGAGTGGELEITESGDVYTLSLLLNQPLSTLGDDDGVYNVLVNLVTSENYDIPLTYSFTYDASVPFYSGLRINGGALDTARSRGKIAQRDERKLGRDTYTTGIDSVSVHYGDTTSGIDPTPNLTYIVVTNSANVAMPCEKSFTNGRWECVLTPPIPVDGTADGTYRIVMHATDMAGNILTTVQEFTVFSPVVPTDLAWNLDATYRVHLDWESGLTASGRRDVRRGNKRALQYYEIDRTRNNTEAMVLTYTTDTAYIDNLVSQPDGSYRYYVTAVYDDGESEAVPTDAIPVKRFAAITVGVLADTTRVSGARVRLAGDDGLYNQVFDATTGSNGEVSFANAFMDHFTVTIEKTGYQTLTADMTVDSDPASFTFNLEPAVETHGDVPSVTQVFQNSPNPFNPVTSIRFGLKEKARVRMTIYNTRGQQVMKLADSELTPGFHTLSWNGTDNAGRKVASGIYFYQFDATGPNTGVHMMKKMILLK
jgi:hypothetical protein